MRIVLPIHSFQPGGVERVAVRLASGWQTRGENVTIVLGRSDGISLPADDAVPQLWMRRSFIPSAPFETLWMIVCLYRYLRSEPADILFCPGNTYTIVCAAMRVLLGAKCPPIIAKVSNDLRRNDLPLPARGAYRIWVRAHTRFIDHFVALAEPMAAEIVQQVQIDWSRVTVIHDPALTSAELERLSAIERPARPSCAVVILTVGRLVKQKNFPLLLRAFAADAFPGDRLVVAGGGPQRARLLRLASSLGIARRVSFVGHHSDILTLLEEADIFALSSDYEGVPAVVVEALAAGLPIVTTQCSSSIEWLTGFGQDGIVVPRRDAVAFGLALRNVRDRSIPTDEGRRRAARFTLEQAATSYLCLFVRLAGRGGIQTARLGNRGNHGASGQANLLKKTLSA